MILVRFRSHSDEQMTADWLLQTEVAAYKLADWLHPQILSQDSVSGCIRTWVRSHMQTATAPLIHFYRWCCSSTGKNLLAASRVNEALGLHTHFLQSDCTTLFRLTKKKYGDIPSAIHSLYIWREPERDCTNLYLV